MPNPTPADREKEKYISPSSCTSFTPRESDFGMDEEHDCFCGGTVKVCANCGGDWHENENQRKKCPKMTPTHPTNPDRDKTCFLLVGDDLIEYFVNDGWEIVNSAPNPCPSPFLFFCIKKVFEKSLSRSERKLLIDLAQQYKNL